jgi:xylulokinase
VGLTVRHGAAHCIRAVLEGVAFGLRDSFELMQAAGLARIEQVRISGGGARSQLWQQILADVFDSPLATVNPTAGAAFGAALLAGVGAGAWVDVQSACDQAIRVTGQVAPIPENAAAYQRAYALYGGLYPALKSTFQRAG